MTTTELSTKAHRKAGRIAPRYVAWSAYAVPVLILTGFGLVTALPIALMSYGVLRDARVKVLRWSVGLTSVLFAIARQLSGAIRPQ